MKGRDLINRFRVLGIAGVVLGVIQVLAALKYMFWMVDYRTVATVNLNRALGIPDYAGLLLILLAGCGVVNLGLGLKLYFEKGKLMERLFVAELAVGVVTGLYAGMVLGLMSGSVR